MIKMMIKVDKKEVKYLVEQHLAHTPCAYCDCYYSGLCDGTKVPEEGCVERYLKYLQIDQEKA